MSSGLEQQLWPPFWNGSCSPAGLTPQGHFSMDQHPLSHAMGASAHRATSRLARGMAGRMATFFPDLENIDSLTVPLTDVDRHLL